MEDASPSGACIRLRAPIQIGSTIRVNWRWGEFTGVTKYCRRDGMEYVTGIQRHTEEMVQTPPLRIGPQSENAAITVSQSSMGKSQGLPIHQEGGTNEISHASHKTEIITVVPCALSQMPGGAGQATYSKESPRSSLPLGPGVSTSTEIEIQRPELSEERKPMATKWLDMALKRQKPDAAPNGTNGARTPDKAALTAAAPPDRAQINSDTKNRPRPHGDLQSAEDIYRAAGIITPNGIQHHEGHRNDQ